MRCTTVQTLAHARLLCVGRAPISQEMLRLIALASSLALAQSYAVCSSSHFNEENEVVKMHDVAGMMSPATVSFDGAAMTKHSCDQIAAIGPDGTLRGVSDIIRDGEFFSLGWLGE